MFQAEDGKLIGDPETEDLWDFFGAFSLFQQKTYNDDDNFSNSHSPNLLWYSIISLFSRVFFFWSDYQCIPFFLVD